MAKQKKLFARPFVKWAGGKTQLIPQLDKLLPVSESGEDFYTRVKSGEYTTYVEPLVGSGAMLFYMMQRYPFRRGVICDRNAELINVYQCLKRNHQRLIDELRTLQTKYDGQATLDGKKGVYLLTRQSFNTTELSHTNCYQKAAEFIFLNKTCFNGLYRVNSKGEFNVPFGQYETATICDADNLKRCADILQKVDIYRGDFTEVEWDIEKGSFVYFDPPYRPLKGKNSFTAYDKDGFGDEEQNRLCEFFIKSGQTGAATMLSNSADENDTSLRDKYESTEGLYVHEVLARRNINSKGDARGQVKELVIVNYACE